MATKLFNPNQYKNWLFPTGKWHGTQVDMEQRYCEKKKAITEKKANKKASLLRKPDAIFRPAPRKNQKPIQVGQRFRGQTRAFGLDLYLGTFSSEKRAEDAINKANDRLLKLYSEIEVQRKDLVDLSFKKLVRAYVKDSCIISYYQLRKKHLKI